MWHSSVLGMMAAIALANTTASHNHHFLFVVRTSKIYFPSSVQVHTTLLTIVTVLYIKSPELTDYIAGRLYAMTNLSGPPAPEPPFSSVSVGLLY